MPRVLPWLSKPSDPLPSKRRQPDASASVKRQRIVSPVRYQNDDIDITEPTTPPAFNDELPSSPTRLAELEPLPTPKIEFMERGVDADDAYMMVEDELFSTAHLFTKHLHQEEYIRLKKLARSRMQEAIDDTGRGVDNRSKQSTEVRMMHKAINHAKVIKKGLKDAEVDSPEAKLTFLTRLMQKDTTIMADLTGIVKTKVKTKASMKIEFANTGSKTSTRKTTTTPHKYSTSTTAMLDSLGISKAAPSYTSTSKAQVFPHDDGTDDSDLDTPAAYGLSKHDASSAPHATVSVLAASPIKPRAQAEPTKAGYDDVKQQGASTERSTARSSASNFLAKRRAALESRQ